MAHFQALEFGLLAQIAALEDEIKQHELAKQPAEDAFEAAKLVKARVNPRFGPWESKAKKQAQLIASAIEI